MKSLIAILCAGLVAFGCSEADHAGEQSDFSAQIVWNKTFGGSLDETIASAVATPDGGLIVIGYTDSDDGDIIKLHASTEILLTRFDANGNIVWTKTIGGSQDDYGMSII